MDRIRHIFLLLLLGVLVVSHAEDNQARKRNRMVSIFNIVKFKNDPCEANDDKSGTCYTEDECADRKGTASGSCAEGYGVCCVFTVGCDAVKNENCTYFQSTGMPEGACNAKICPCASNICQLRLDFLTFNIAQPSDDAVGPVSKALNGVIVSGAGKDVTNMGQCLTDTFTVTSPGGIAPPTICGQNDGQHIYVDASNDCNTLAFQLAGMGTRMWEIKVTQYSCEFSNLAPSGCLQYYYGVNAGQDNQQMPLTDGTVESFNFAGKIHLANQNQNICIRRELNRCRICYSAAAMMFDVSSNAADDEGIAGKSGSCCGYGKDGMGTNGYDCVIIPGASKGTANKMDVQASEFCGRQLATAALGEAKPAATVCSMVVPFQIRFLSDSFEFAGKESAKNPDGFKIDYKQIACV